MKNFASGRLAGALALSVLLSVGGVTVLAHDMWIEPTSYRPDSGRPLGLRLRIGQDFLGDPLPRDPALIDRFIVVDGDGEKPVIGRDGADPAGLLRLTAPGLAIVGYHSKPSAVVLTPQKFNQYLSEEGLEAVAALRASRGETNAEARELFVRCAKTLLLAGPATDAQKDRALGFPFELVAGRNPYVLEPGDSLPVRLTYRDKPIAGVLVVALNQRDPTVKVSARSDQAGRVQLRLAHAGPWLIKAVHMIPAAQGADHQWDSFWASLTFDLSDAAGRRTPSSQR